MHLQTTRTVLIKNKTVENNMSPDESTQVHVKFIQANDHKIMRYFTESSISSLSNSICPQNKFMISRLIHNNTPTFSLLLLVAMSTTGPAVAKSPLPDELQRSESMERVTTLYAAQLGTANTPQEKATLAKRIIAELGTHKESSDRFAILRLSLDLSRSSEDWETAINIVRLMQQEFEIEAQNVERQLKILKDKKKAAGKMRVEFSEEKKSTSQRRSSQQLTWPEDSEQLVVDLETPYEAASLGASGDVIVLLLTLQDKLAIFDVNLGKITNKLPLENSNVKFCVGSDSIYIAYPDTNTIERWSLKTYKKMSSSKLPFQNAIENLVIGRNTNGPILAGAERESGVFLDGKSLRPIATRVFDRQYQPVGQIPGGGPTIRTRASANGRVFSTWGTSGSPGGFRTLVLKGNLVDTYYAHDTMGYIAPNPMGDLMYTAKGIYTNQTKQYAANKALHAQSFFVPAVDSDYSVSLVRSDRTDGASSARANIHMRGNPQPIQTLPKIAFRPGGYGDFHNRDLMPLDLRIFLYAKRGLLITLPETNRQIVLHRVEGLDSK
ncbi:MAG TPA: hypothetical protein DEF45_04710 [Rhodopirellula sp.]|nr:hypothetical protein [Rhodopirellula sp.]